MRAGVIYKYTSPSGKVYIGQTTNEQQRYRTHKYKSKNPDSYFHKAINKYGIENFQYEVILRASSNQPERLKFILDTMEKYYIKKYNSNNRLIGYNLTIGGEGLSSPSLETRKKISESNKNKIVTEQMKKQIANTLKAKYESGELIVHNKKAIEVYLNDKLIRVYDSITEAANSLSICCGSIGNILSGRAKRTRQGYTFKYRKEV